MYFRCYILIRLKIIGTEWKVVDKIKGLKSKNDGNDWEVTYVSPIYGGWDLIIECSFKKLLHLDELISFCRKDKDLSEWIEETTTLIGLKPDYNR